ncbi:MAG: DeoR/GlpR family DNA-binding transcription regulator [Dermatophilus congolensis]|nr:DeoR/GlpR family DNA-binding transcription regulator [Dermatophilus congolensis]
MFPQERHEFIVGKAQAESRVDVASLANELDVTPETIRRDLTVLERQGFVRRVHGGAIAVEKLRFEPNVSTRLRTFEAEKDRIGRRAALEIPESSTVLLDAGTTTAVIARHLPAGGELTVVTNSVAIAALLEDRNDVSVFILGGRLRARTLAATGDWAIDALASVHVDIAFMGTNGISTTRGLTTPDQAEASTKAAMIASAERTVVVSDHSKFGVAHFARFARIDDIDLVITDTDLDEETAHDMETAGPRVVRV